MTYNITALNNATTPPQLVSAINTVSNGLFGGALFLLVYFLIILNTPEEYTPNVLLVVSFLMSIIAGIMFTLQWLPFWIIPLNITVLVGAIFWKIWGG
jgi:hypothetical protein